MALFKIGDRFPDYPNHFFDGNDIKGVGVYADADNTKVGSVHDILVDDEGRIQYLVVDTGFWILGKKVLLPIGCCRDAAKGDRIYASGLTEEQVETLPEYRDDLVVDYDYEEQVRSVYRGRHRQSVSVEQSVPVEELGVIGYIASPAPPAETPPTPPPSPGVTAAAPPPPANITMPAQDKRPDSDAYAREPDLYAMNDDHRRLRLYEERLVASKTRRKTGEVTVTKRIEVEPVEGSVPLRKEKIVIEIESVPGVTHVNVAGKDVNTGSSARAGMYADYAEIRKEPVVRQEVTIRKAVDEEIVTVRDTVRREEIDITEHGSPDVEVSAVDDVNSTA